MLVLTKCFCFISSIRFFSTSRDITRSSRSANTRMDFRSCSFGREKRESIIKGMAVKRALRASESFDVGNAIHKKFIPEGWSGEWKISPLHDRLIDLSRSAFVSRFARKSRASISRFFSASQHISAFIGAFLVLFFFFKGNCGAPAAILSIAGTDLREMSV